MSEQWAITILTVVVGWVAYELRSLRAAMDGFVKKTDCTSDMDGHCVEIRNLWKETREQGERISRLETFHEDNEK